MQPVDFEKYRRTNIVAEKGGKNKAEERSCKKTTDKTRLMWQLKLFYICASRFYEIAKGLLFVREKSKSARIFINRRGFAADI
jgi:hypothetical protein